MHRIAVSRHTALHSHGHPLHRHSPSPRALPTTCSSTDNPQQPTYQSTRDFLNSLRATVRLLFIIPCAAFTPRPSQPPTPPETTATTPHIPTRQGRTPARVLGVDFGTRRTGVAVSALGLAPRPLEVLDSRGSYLDLATRILALAAQQRVDGIVVGLPVTRRGSIRRANTDSQQVVVFTSQQHDYRPSC